MFFRVESMLDAAAPPGFNVLAQLIGPVPSGVSCPMLLPGEDRAPLQVIVPHGSTVSTVAMGVKRAKVP